MNPHPRNPTEIPFLEDAHLCDVIRNLGSGQVHITVFGAHNMDSGGTKHEFFALIIISDGSKEKRLRTEAVKCIDGDLVWNTEFILSIYQKHQPVEIKIMKHGQIKPTTIGIVTLVPGEQTPYIPKRKKFVILDKNGNKLNSEGEVELEIIYTPCRVSPEFGHRLFTKLPRQKMFLERKHFYPGEAIKGMFVVGVGTEYLIHGIRLSFIGEQKATLTYHNKVASSCHFHLFNCTSTVFGSPLKKGGEIDPSTFILKSGYYSFPFQFTLPMKLPPTLNLRHGSVNYKIVSRIDSPKNKHTTTFETPFTIHAVYPNPIPGPTIPLRVTHPNKNINLAINVQCEKKCLMSGEVVRTSVTIANDTRDEVVEKVMLKLMCHQRTVTAPISVGFQSTCLLTVQVAGDFLPVVSSDTQQFEAQFNLPDSLEPSLHPMFSPLVNIGYTVRVWCLTKEKKLHDFQYLGADVPIFVVPNTQFIEPSLYNVVPPVQPQGIPYQIYKISPSEIKNSAIVLDESDRNNVERSEGVSGVFYPSTSKMFSDDQTEFTECELEESVLESGVSLVDLESSISASEHGHINSRGKSGGFPDVGKALFATSSNFERL